MSYDRTNKQTEITLKTIFKAEVSHGFQNLQIFSSKNDSEN